MSLKKFIQFDKNTLKGHFKNIKYFDNSIFWNRYMKKSLLLLLLMILSTGNILSMKKAENLEDLVITKKMIQDFKIFGTVINDVQKLLKNNSSENQNPDDLVTQDLVTQYVSDTFKDRQDDIGILKKVAFNLIKSQRVPQDKKNISILLLSACNKLIGSHNVAKKNKGKEKETENRNDNVESKKEPNISYTEPFDEFNLDLIGENLKISLHNLSDVLEKYQIYDPLQRIQIANFINNYVKSQPDNNIAQLLNLIVKMNNLHGSTRKIPCFETPENLDQFISGCVRFIASKACRIARIDSFKIGIDYRPVEASKPVEKTKQANMFSNFLSLSFIYSQETPVIRTDNIVRNKIPHLKYNTYSELIKGNKVNFDSNYLGKKCEKACLWLDNLKLSPEAAQLVASFIMGKKFIDKIKSKQYFYRNRNDYYSGTQHSVCYSPKGTIAFGGKAGTITMTTDSLNDAVALNSCYRKVGKVHALSFSPQGGLIAAARSNSVKIPIYNTAVKDKVKTQLVHTAPPKAVSFSNNDVVSGSDKTVHLWDVNKESCKQTFQCLNPVKDIAIAPDTVTYAVCSGNSIQFLDNRTESTPGKLTFGSLTNSVSYSPDGSLLVTTKEGFSIHDPRKIKPLVQYNLDTPVYKGGFSPLGNQFYILHDARRDYTENRYYNLAYKGSRHYGGKTQIWDLNNSKEVAMHRLSCYEALACEFSPDGTKFAIVTNRGEPRSLIRGGFACIYQSFDTEKESSNKISNPATALAISCMNLVEDKKQVTFDHPIFRRLISNKVRKSLNQ